MLSILIPTYNRADILPRSLAVLDDAVPRSEIEVLFVDNASTDGTHSLLLDYAASRPHVTVLRNPQNLGIFRSLYRGIVSARRDWLLVLSDEDAVKPALFPMLAQVWRAAPSVGAVLFSQTDFHFFPKPSQAVVERAGRKAAHCAYWISGYVGGLVFNRGRLDLRNMPLEPCLFLQRRLMCQLALTNDVCFAPYDDYLMPEFNQSPRTEFAVRTNDWAIGEWMDHVDLVLDAPGAVTEFSPDERVLHGGALRAKVYNMFVAYLHRALDTTDTAGADAFVAAVFDDRRFVQDLFFWEMLFNDLVAMPEGRRRQICEILEKHRPGATRKLEG